MCIRDRNRHAPILFPYCGRLKGGAFTHNGVSYEGGQHGFARDMEHALVEQSGDSVTPVSYTHLGCGGAGSSSAAASASGSAAAGTSASPAGALDPNIKATLTFATYDNEAMDCLLYTSRCV